MNTTNIRGALAYFALFLFLFLVYPLLSEGKGYLISENTEGNVNKETVHLINEPDITQIKEKPELDIPKSSYRYQLHIPTIAVNAGVRAMGVEADGRMAVPNNYTEVGWYSHGTEPGHSGNAVMGAHVDNGSSVSGVFKKLHTLSVGDSVFLTDPQGKELHYKVTGTKVYDRNEKNTSDVWSSTDGKSHLILITCFGKWLSNENTYENRIVVFTELVK